MKKISLLMLSLVAAFGLVLTSCNDDDDSGVAKAVLASASVVNYDATQAPGQIITVYSDATWTCEHPDWVTIEPETGSGTTEVRISVADNIRDGAVDLPRNAEVVFKGILKSSEAHVVIRQNGNPYRDVQPSTIAEMEKVDDGIASVINNLTVTTVFNNAFMATDGKRNVLVNYAGRVDKGEVVNVKAIKNTDAQKFAVLTADEVTKGTQASSLPAAVDVTDKIDTWKGEARTYVTLTGKVNGKNIEIGNASNKAVVLDAAKGIDMNELGGHSVTVTGYYSGTASPAFNIYVASVEDHGIVEVIYWKEDFEWFEPWSSQKPAGATIEENNSDATAQQLGTNKVDDVSTYQALLAKGYQILATHSKDKAERKPEAQTYLQRNYIKFGLTGYYSGIVMPVKLDNPIPAEDALILAFDWSSMRQGSGVWDNTVLKVVVETKGKDAQEFEVGPCNFATGAAFAWIPASFELEPGSVDNTTKITIRNADSQWPDPNDKGAAYRWFLDNVKIIQK